MDARILLARLYTRRGLPDLALEHYRLGAALFPGSVVVSLELTKALHAAGETGQALKAAQACLDKHPDGSWELLSLAGILEDELGQWAQAEIAHRTALTLAPGRSGLYNNLGYNLLLQGKFEEATAEFHNAIKADPLSAIAHNNLGDALSKLSKFDDALAEWQLVGGPAVAHNNLAAALIAVGRYADARAEIAVALRFRHDFPAAYMNLRLVAERDGQPATVSGAVER
jgi:Flp pilus assembly protein TadD